MNIANRKVLILNKTWAAVNIVSLRKAVTRLFGEDPSGRPIASILDTRNDFQTYSWEDWCELEPDDGEEVIHTQHKNIRIPEILLLNNYDRYPLKKNGWSKPALIARDKQECQYCGKKIAKADVTIDHVLPRCQGGKNSWQNCVVACGPCNSKKADKTPEQAGMKLIKIPVKPKVALFKCDTDRIPTSWTSFVADLVD